MLGGDVAARQLAEWLNGLADRLEPIGREATARRLMGRVGCTVYVNIKCRYRWIHPTPPMSLRRWRGKVKE